MFKFNAISVFLTYPKATLSKERVLDLIREITPVQTYCISQEKHADGTDHIHAIIRFQRRFHRDDPKVFDLEGFHPNIKTLKTSADFKRSCEYAKKDGNFITNVVEKLSHKAEMGRYLLENGLTGSSLKEYPELVFSNLNSIRQWLQLINPEVLRAPTSSKKSGIWLHGPSNTGKSTWLRALLETWDGAEVPENNDWSHVRKETNLVYAEEYRGCLTVQQLNKIVDGNTRLNTKGGSVHLPKVRVVVVSNFSIRDCYVHISDQIYSTLLNRFHEIDSSINLPRFPLYDI